MLAKVSVHFFLEGCRVCPTKVIRNHGKQQKMNQMTPKSFKHIQTKECWPSMFLKHAVHFPPTCLPRDLHQSVLFVFRTEQNSSKFVHAMPPVGLSWVAFINFYRTFCLQPFWLPLLSHIFFFRGVFNTCASIPSNGIQYSRPWKIHQKYSTKIVLNQPDVCFMFFMAFGFGWFWMQQKFRLKGGLKVKGVLNIIFDILRVDSRQILLECFLVHECHW
jgi:hypothetical protein